MKKVTYLSILLSALLLAFAGCGGGSSDSSTSSSSSTTTTSTDSVSGTVSASKLKGVNVCVEDSEKCAVTDQEGYFKIEGITLPAVLDVKLGNSVLKKLKVDTSTLDITPAVLADDNSTLAAYVGALLHKAGGCDISADECDLSNVGTLDIQGAVGEEFMEKMQNALSTNSSFTFSVNGEDMSISADDEQLYLSYNPTMSGVKEFSYSGAAAAGDLMNFTFDTETNKLNYTITGSVYSSISGTKELVNLYGDTFFTDKDTNREFYFFSGSLGVGVLGIPGEDKMAFLVGLQLPSTDISENLIVNKEFNYIDFDDAGNVSFAIVDVNKSDTGERTWQAYDFDGASWQSEGGVWVPKGSFIEIYDSNNNKIANLIIKPGVNRAGFVVDDLDGGFGVGLEAKPLEASEIGGTFAYYDSDFTDDSSCFGDVSLSGTTFSAKEKYCIDSTGALSPSDETDSGSLTLNPEVGGRVLNGIAKVNESDDLSSEYVFVDSEDGYYISVGFDSNGQAQFLSIGSNKSIK